MQTELIEQVMAALDALAATDRDLLMLRFLERLSAEEAAKVQGISVATCRKRFTRALQKLSRQLAGPHASSSRGETPYSEQ